MELLLACEDLIPQVNDQPENNITVADIDRWRRFFDCSAAEAIQQIRDWRANFGRQTIPIDTWHLIKHNLEPTGYDKETYECAVATRRFQDPTARSSQPQAPSKDLTSSYIVRLEGPITDAETLKDFADLPTLPPVFRGSTDDNETEYQFCLVDGNARLKILKKLAALQSSFRRTFIRDSKAKKELCPHSLYPTLGNDTTMPQFRPGTSVTFLPSQDHYPVCYFFYGTLADAAVLSRVVDLSADCPPTYREARIKGGRITTWAGKYLGLVDCDWDAFVHGSAYLVEDVENENVLRYYETDMYEVVRCEIEFEGDGGRDMGLTFRLRDS